MSTEMGAPSEPSDGGPEVMASIDTSEPESRLVIADITVDDAWLAIGAGEAVTLLDWR